MLEMAFFRIGRAPHAAMRAVSPLAASALLCLAAAQARASQPAASQPAAAVPGYDTLIAHKGECIDAPENTLPAFRMAVERGFGFECDVYFSKDGRVFTSHDHDMARLTGGANTNKFHDALWDEISRLNAGGQGKWKGSRFDGTRPALLEEVLSLARDGRMIYIDVKTGPEIVPHIRRVFDAQTRATPENALFISFEKDTCKALKEQMGEYRVLWISNSKHWETPGFPPVTAEEVIAAMRETGADGVDIHYLPDAFTPEFASAVRDAGCELHVWTIDDLEDAREALRRGAQSVTTNYAEKMVELAAATGGAGLKCAYSPEVAARPRMRGVMSPGGDMAEDDFRTLREWGATLLRYQMVRDWHAVDGNRDLEEYDRWLDGRLDHLDKVVLPLAAKYGLMVVPDLHVTPGGRDAGAEANMFYDAAFAGHFVEVWRRIARRFRGREGIYGYDLVNEPCHRREPLPGCDSWNLQRRAAEAIREEDPLVPVIVEAGGWDAPAAFAALRPLPLANVIYEVHMYEPFDFTHQRVLGTRPWTVAYPNAGKGWDRDFVKAELRAVRDFQLMHGARVFAGEFSAVCWAPGAEDWLRDCIAVFEEWGWDWTYHAFREWPGWSVEHAGEDDASLRPASDTPRKRALLDGFRN